MKFSVFFISIVFIVSMSHGEFEQIGALIDVPVATPPEENFFSIIPSGSFTLADDPHSAEMNLALSFSIAGRGEISLSALTPENYALRGKLAVLEEKESTPALAIGIDNITYTQWVSPVGGEDTTGLLDDLGYGKERPKEAFSVFLVATKNFENLAVPFSTTIGLGRGKFVGYGPLSKYTNSDVFFDSNHSLSFGVFGGVALKFTPNLSAIVEYDGRDGNLGLRYELRHLVFNLAFTHLEQLRSHGAIHPRVALGVAIKSTIFTPPKKGFIAGRVFDTYSKEPVDASIIISDTELEPILVRGDYDIALSPGIYSLTIISEGYIAKKFKVTVRPEGQVRLDIPMLNLAKNDSLKLHLKMGEAFINEGKIRLARNEFARVLEIYPDHPMARRQLSELDETIAELIVNHKKIAINYSQEGWLEEAIFEWKEVLSLDPNDGAAADSIAELQRRLGQKEDIESSIKLMQKTTPERKQPARPKLSSEEIDAMYNKALVHYFSEEYEDALQIFQEILQADPSHTKAEKYLERTKRILGL